jgi:hypothetical protein
MKSHSCKKTRGPGAPSTIPLTSDAAPSAPVDTAADLAPITGLVSADPKCNKKKMRPPFAVTSTHRAGDAACSS